MKAKCHGTPLILSAVLVVLTFYSFLLCQYVKDLFSHQNLDRVEDRIDFVYPFPHENVENNGFEPLTPCVQSRCSSQLS